MHFTLSSSSHTQKRCEVGIIIPMLPMKKLSKEMTWLRS